jgi:hypothetical protein
MDVVRDYLQQRGYADYVVSEGIEGLVKRWEHVVASVVSQQEQFQDDYLNDMDGRRILEEALAVATPEESARWKVRVADADQQIRSHLVPTTECLWGEQNARAYGYSRERDWWYFHRPEVVESEWRTF